MYLTAIKDNLLSRINHGWGAKAYILIACDKSKMQRQVTTCTKQSSQTKPSKPCPLALTSSS